MKNKSETGSASAPPPREEKPALWLWSQFALDSLAWIVAIALALLLRYELDVTLISYWGATALTAVAVATQLLAGWGFALYRGRYSFGSFHEARLLVAVTVIVAATTVIFDFIVYKEIHIARSIGAIAFPFACLFMAAVRYIKRLYVEGKARPGEGAQRTLVYGAGFLGNSLVNRMLQDPSSPYFPVGLVDDDPAKKHLRLSSVSVLGRGTDLPDVVRRTRASVLVLAFGQVEAAKVREISDAVAGLRVRVLVLPPLKDMLSGEGAGISDFREVDVEDLIGRRPVDIEVEQIVGYVAGKRVLVTGAGGSIGSELCRQLSGFKPAELIMLDHDETGLQHTQISISGHGLLNGRDTVLADIRDAAAIAAIFRDRRPEVVFHAAALKHAPLLQQYPQEAWKTNVLGTLNVLRAAQAVAVTSFVNVSTDKAASPTTALGHSKRSAEKLTAWAAQQTSSTYVSVRFGNVIGSRGSMLPLFSEQIRNGGPLTVTHQDVTRFFMTIPEACQLVIQAGAIGNGGEVLILDMGEPVKILDVARRMIAMSGRDINIVFTGLRPSEKMHEQLVGVGETNAKALHPKISQTTAPAQDPASLDLDVWLQRCRLESGAEPSELDDSDDGALAAGA
ncbi:polysaccharide biosynthesis protein [Paenarthrobacter sp. Z7-10]|uniref:polysaccharide biosynthesis protein n=1 Tax=Paenarthrobacter sp. Z7-10 TaxID=2787635 RepID=UPI0022A92548|nr:nucleoside-diphosphate sugar epimerase/dehydratase [Paenarthrobacter sp. Z7-10]MCZ2402414.1 polysaccharide biosynthesis protein [Paenarthrobacter sp. Z7-10]